LLSAFAAYLEISIKSDRVCFVVVKLGLQVTSAA